MQLRVVDKAGKVLAFSLVYFFRHRPDFMADAGVYDEKDPADVEDGLGADRLKKGKFRFRLKRGKAMRGFNNRYTHLGVASKLTAEERQISQNVRQIICTHSAPLILAALAVNQALQTSYSLRGLGYLAFFMFFAHSYHRLSVVWQSLVAMDSPVQFCAACCSTVYTISCVCCDG